MAQRAQQDDHCITGDDMPAQARKIQGSSGDETFIGRIIVKFRTAPELDAKALQRLCDEIARLANASLVRPPSASGRAVFQVAAQSTAGALLDEIRRLPFVQYVEREVTDHSSSQ
jgi:hypothetical protein